jgi:hypothetical protein
VSRLVVVVPLKEGTREAARALIDEGPPFELGDTRFDRHAVYLTDHEAIFVFESEDESRTLDLPGEDESLWTAARAWREIAAGRPRVAMTRFTWEREAP